LEKAKLAAQDRRADIQQRLANRRSAIEAAAASIGSGGSSKEVIARAHELLAWTEAS